ncbi:MAG: tetratricopeptide repeat protein [Planctomycetota bacterium]|nr:tetratricopeptide repeat protein [Planctomycetota bacterium]MDE2216532.1 tetratricopeptide repeat protein [Planctomycetota bacterium]
MTAKKLFYVALVIPFISLVLAVDSKIIFGVENSYKYAKQLERFQRSAFHQFKSGLQQTFDELEQKSDNLEAMNQNLEGRVNVLSSEKDKLNKTLAQVKTKQSTLEKEHTKLKKKATSLEVAYKKLSGKGNVASTSKKAKKLAAKKTSVAKNAKKKSTVPKSTAKKTVGNKVSSAEKQEENALSSYPTTADAGKLPEEQKKEAVGGLDAKKINERGIEYGKKGMYDQAIKEFRKVAEIEPNMANAHYNLGLAYKKKGMLAEANKEFAEYERLKSQNN